MLPTEKIIMKKFCFIPCPPERCNCHNGNPELWALQQARFAKASEAATQNRSNSPDKGNAAS